MALFHGDAF
ncbi:hypothetical protein YPPY34_0680, partial [Yersinia pestis PY-34]